MALAVRRGAQGLAHLARVWGRCLTMVTPGAPRDTATLPARPTTYPTHAHIEPKHPLHLALESVCSPSCQNL